MIWDLIKTILAYPVNWFWDKYDQCKETGNVVKMILLWFVSLTGLLAFGGGMFLLAGYLLANHLLLVGIVTAAIWFYSYMHENRLKSSETENVQKERNMQSLMVQADKLYPTMRNIVYQSAKDFAPNIGAKIPRLLGEIEMPEDHYLISNDLCYYQFHLVKENIREVYSQNDLAEFRLEIQTSIGNKLRSGAFPMLQIEQYKDKYGNWIDAVVIDTIEDVGTDFILQMVFSSPEYAEYIHRMKLNIKRYTDQPVPDAEWKDM